MGGFNFGSLFSGIGSFISGNASASSYNNSANFDEEAARVTKLEGSLKNNAINRQIFQVGGKGVAAAGANGLADTGSALDVIHNNRQQGFLTRAVNSMQTNLQYRNYESQAATARTMASASSTSGMLGLLGGVMGMFSDDRLKEDVKFIGRRGDGIGIYQFKYTGDKKVYEGVMAKEVEVLFPASVGKDVDGYMYVDYDSLGIEFKEAA